MIEFQNTERRYDNLHDTDNMTYIGRSGQTSVNVLGSLFYEFVPHRAYPRFAEDSADHWEWRVSLSRQLFNSWISGNNRGEQRRRAVMMEWKETRLKEENEGVILR